MRVNAQAKASLAGLESLAERASDLKPAWEDVADVWRERQVGVFANRLAPLKPSTVKRKGHRSPLIETGALRRATFESSPVKSTKDTAAFGIPKGKPIRKLAILHRTGRASMAKRNAVPPLRVKEKQRILEILREHVFKDAT